MVRKIIWTVLAYQIFKDILEYYNQRNGSSIYSQKLNREIYILTKLLSKQPSIGSIISNTEDRVIVKGNLKIFYKVNSLEIVIKLVWDCRQNPEKLKVYLNE